AAGRLEAGEGRAARLHLGKTAELKLEAEGPFHVSRFHCFPDRHGELGEGVCETEHETVRAELGRDRDQVVAVQVGKTLPRSLAGRPVERAAEARPDVLAADDSRVLRQAAEM